MAGALSPAETAQSSMGSIDEEQLSTAASSNVLPIARRGGFMDSGGYTKSGELPAAECMHLHSERELKQELDGVQKKLAPNAEWTTRIQALLRLEGIVLGGASSWQAFLELIRPLQDPIIAQLLDRRSAVSRQACQLICVLSRAMGSQFDSLAVHMMPALFKVLVITVQVMADAAHDCVKAIVTNSHSHRIMQRIGDAICKDRSPKLRLCCAEYLRQVIEDWDAVEYERSTDALEAAIKAAVKDALSETRNAGRAAFRAYARARPDRVASLLDSVDAGLRQKLREGLQEGLPPTTRMTAAPVKPPSRRQSAIPAPQAPCEPHSAPQRVTGAPLPRGRASLAVLPEMAAPVQAAQPPRAAMKPRKSLAGAALRINMPVDARGAYGESRERLMASQPALAMQQPAGRGLHTEGSELRSYSYSDASAAALPFAQLLANAASGGSDWKVRVEGFENLTAVLSSPSAAAHVAAHLDRLVALFIENIGEAHAKVAAACLHALAAAFSTAGAQLERHLDRLVPLLLLRAVDGKEPIRRAAAQALTILPGSVSPDTYLASLTGAVGSRRSTKAQIAAMESFIAATEQRLLPSSSLIPHILRDWVECLAALAVDKHLEVRRMAEQALAAVHSQVDSGVLREHLASVDLASDARTTLLQILQVAGATPLPTDERAAESAETDVRIGEPALARQNGGEEEQELESLRQLRLSDDFPAAAADAAASSSQSTTSVEVRSKAQPVRSQAACSSQAQPNEQTPYAQPFVAVPDGEYRGSENVLLLEEGTPSSWTLPVPHVQRGPLSPLPGSSNLHNQPAGPQGLPSPKLETPLSMRTPSGAKLFSLSQFATPPTALPARRTFGSVADAQAHLEMLVGGVRGAVPLLSLQALPAALASTPSAVWEPMIAKSMLPALEARALRGELAEHKAALLGLEALGRHAVLLDMAAFEGTIPRLLTCCCDPSREVCMLAQQALEAVAGKLPRQQAFRTLVDALHKEQQDGMGEAPIVQTLLQCCAALVKDMGQAEADAALQGPLMPALVKAFQHSCADVRKSVVFLLVDAWRKLGQNLTPHLKDLSTSQQKLVAIYIDRASQDQM